VTLARYRHTPWG